MPILKVKDTSDNTWKSIMAIKGEKGNTGNPSETVSDTIIDTGHSYSNSKTNELLNTKVDKTSILNSLVCTTEGYVADARTVKTVNDKVDANTNSISTLNNNLATEIEKVFATTDFTTNVSAVDTCYAYKYGHKTNLRLTFCAGAVISAGTTILNIPSGFRPPRNVKAMFSYGGGTVNCVTVYTDGSVKADMDIPSGVWSFIYLCY